MTTLNDELAPLGRILSLTPAFYGTEVRIALHRPAVTFEPESAPKCLFITSIGRGLKACTRWNYLRCMGSIVMPSKTHFPVTFLNRPRPIWTGYGRLRRKAVEVIDIIVESGDEDTDWPLFCELARLGFAYKGADRVARRKAKRA